jgi:NADH:ubiquinone oxidoreductase subunit 4 (subunit M)
MYRGPSPERLVPLNRREATIGYTLLGLAILLGVYPPLLLNLVQPSVARLVEQADQAYVGLHQRPAEVPVDPPR